MRGFLRRTLQIVGYTFSFVGALLLLAWAVRGARPALECGVIEAAQALDWPAAYACLDKADYDPLIGLVTLIVGVLAWLAARFAPGNNGSVYDPTPEERARNRAALANRVQKTWIDGVLKQALYEAVLIALGWQPSPEAVEMRPWSIKAGRPDEAGTLAPPTVGMAALFDQSEGALLILGEPGSGKTTMLLRLTQELLHRQKAENSHPVPIVFNLSSWQGKKQSIADWLVNELRRFYDVPGQIARHLVDHGEVALMLDGLDEVQAEIRKECVAAINAYRSERIVPVALCCRVAEYRELKPKLVAQLAVTLQPLTPEQQDEYLDKLALPEAGRLKAALHADGALREVAASPLMLSVMLGAGDYLRLDNAGTTSGGLRTAIWDAYLQNMLNRERKTQAHYPAQQVVRQLSWLAEKMVQQWRSILYLEHLSTDWLKMGVSNLIIYADFMLALAFPFGFILGPVAWYLYSFWGWTLVFAVGNFVCLAKFWAELSSKDFSYYQGPWPVWLLMAISCAWTICLLIIPFIILIYFELPGLILTGLSTLLLHSLLHGLYSGAPVEPSDAESIDITDKPNAKVARQLKHVTGASLFVGVLAGMLWLALGSHFQIVGNLSMSPIMVGVCLAMTTAIILGLGDFVGYYLFRSVLWLKGYVPMNYVRFLDYCTDRILLRKVGGGYIFIHRTFMEHMATIDPTKFDFDTPAGKSKA